MGLERVFDLLSLGVGPPGQHVDDGLLVGAESLHGRPERGRVRVRVEVSRRANRGRALRTTNTRKGLEKRPADRADDGREGADGHLSAAARAQPVRVVL